jgi:ornithine cyclodeaminase/alanine dehydrogenase-like protein (mu-crystallin family)
VTGTVILDQPDVSSVFLREPALGRQACEDAFRYVEAGQVIAPVKRYVQLPEAESADRVISLPVRVVSPPLVGVKWIGSAAANWKTRLPRATAIIVLNHPGTHEPKGNRFGRTDQPNGV